MEASTEAPQLVVLGSSAGGIDVLSAIIESIPTEFAAPIVIAQHLDPRHPSHLAEILSRRASVPVHGVTEMTALEPGNAYILPADGAMEVQLGALLSSGEGPTRPTPSIDRILTSAAAAYGEGLTAVILTGSGSDGAAGARQVKAGGGTVVIQNPDTAQYRSMPEAISPSMVDIVADAAAIGPLLQELTSQPRAARRGDEDRQLRSFLDYVRSRGGIDFSTYKRGTILRRLQRRMLSTGTDDLKGYRKYIEDHPDEFGRLTSSFLIKVTEFFRDPELFDHLRHEVLPRLIDEARAGERELRIWSAGCATGEEAYSLAMLVADALGEELPSFNVRIFATDVDLDAIAFARRGTYAASVAASVPEDLRDRYFDVAGDRFEVKKSIRAMTVFGQHDLGQRAPFPRVDLALCRNVLIYFTQDLQRRALHLFAFALRDGGCLVLGKSESTSPLPEHFVLTEPRLKVYRRQGERVLIPPARARGGGPVPSLKLPLARRPGWTDMGKPAAAGDPDRPVTLTERAEQLLLRLPVGIVLVDRNYDIQLINQAARELLGLHSQAVAEDLIHLLGGELAGTVKSLVDGVIRNRAVAPAVVELSSVTADREERRFVEVKAQPFTGADNRAPVEWIVVVATDVSGSVGAARDLADSATREVAKGTRAAEQAEVLAAANEELRSANRDLTEANAELRTANEELLVASEEVQAATEEVETLNEELQATNEELETLNEELQATVEELNTTNEDLEARTVELQEVASSVEHQRAASEEERARLLAVLDLIDEPILIVDRDGAVVKANEPFRLMVGEPDVALAADGRGSSKRPRQHLGVRAATEPFEETVSVSGTTFRVLGRPLDGGDGSAGALIFRKG